MAITSQLTSIATNKFYPEAIDNIYVERAALALIDKECGHEDSGGENVEHFIEYAKNTQGGAYSNGAQRSYNFEEKATKVYYKWCSYEQVALVRTWDLNRAVKDKAKIDLMKLEVNSSVKKMADDLVTDLFSANTSASEGMVGLRKICKSSDTTNPLGGLSSADFSGWVATVDTTETVMRSTSLLIMAAAMRAGDMSVDPDIALMSDKAYNRLVIELLGAGQLQLDENNKKMIALGFKGIKVGNIVVYFDAAIPYDTENTEEYAFVFKKKHLFYTKNTEENMKRSEWRELEAPKGKVLACHLNHTCAISTDKRKAFGSFNDINNTL